MLWCDRRTAPTLFSTLAWHPPVGDTRRIGKDSPVHRPDGLRPSRRRIAARDQRFEGYPNTLACHIRRAAGTHEYQYYGSTGQRRAEGWRGSSDDERPRANLAARGRRPGGYIMPFLATYHLHTINVQHALRALPYTMGTSGGPASLPCYLAASFTTNSIKTTPRNASPRCLFRGATPLLILQFPQFPGHAHPNLTAFGRIPADHAVPVLVASPPPAGVWVGEARVHARPVAQARAAGEPGAVVARDGDARRPAADARRWEPVRESGNATSSRRHARAATRDHRRSHDGRWRLRGLARLRSALRRAGPAM